MESKGKNIPVLDINNLKPTPKRRNKLIVKSEVAEYVLICVAWPYANGPLHLGHVAG